jgi:hypothetical protein
MELMLWRWSTSVQITSELIIVVFFAEAAVREADEAMSRNQDASRHASISAYPAGPRAGRGSYDDLYTAVV